MYHAIKVINFSYTQNIVLALYILEQIGFTVESLQKMDTEETNRTDPSDPGLYCLLGLFCVKALEIEALFKCFDYAFCALI